MLATLRRTRVGQLLIQLLAPELLHVSQVCASRKKKKKMLSLLLPINTHETSSH